MLDVTQLIGFGSGGKDTPSFVGAASANAGSAITYPAGTQDGDFIVMSLVSSVALVTPTGYTQQTTNLGWGAGFNSAIYTRTVSGETSISFSGNCASICVYRGASGVGTIGSWVTSGTTDTTLVITGITTIGTNSLVLGCMMDRDAVAPTKPADFTSRVAFAGSVFGSGMADLSTPGPTSTGNKTWTQSNSLNFAASGVHIEVIP